MKLSGIILPLILLTTITLPTKVRTLFSEATATRQTRVRLEEDYQLIPFKSVDEKALELNQPWRSNNIYLGGGVKMHGERILWPPFQILHTIF